MGDEFFTVSKSWSMRARRKRVRQCPLSTFMIAYTEISILREILETWHSDHLPKRIVVWIGIVHVECKDQFTFTTWSLGPFCGATTACSFGMVKFGRIILVSLFFFSIHISCIVPVHVNVMTTIFSQRRYLLLPIEERVELRLNSKIEARSLPCDA